MVGQVNSQVEDNLGRVHPYAAPLAISLFFFILFCNWLELLPLRINEETHLLTVPTADTNLTYALAAVTIVSVWAYGIQQKGVRGYFKHFFEPFPVMFPLNLLEELIKPITLALRLFGNIFAGGIMLALIGLMPLYIMWAPNVLWKAFGGAIAVIQAFIFALLTVLYFAMAGAGHGDEHEDEHDARRRARRLRGRLRYQWADPPGHPPTEVNRGAARGAQVEEKVHGSRGFSRAGRCVHRRRHRPGRRRHRRRCR